MLQNNFPIQEQFYKYYGEEFLGLQKYMLHEEDLGRRPKLFFAFSAFLRGGNVEAINLAGPFLKLCLDQIHVLMLEGGVDTVADAKQRNLLQKLMGFVTAMNSNEIYNVQLRLKKLQNPEGTTGDDGESDVEEEIVEGEGGTGPMKIRKLNLKNDKKFRRKDEDYRDNESAEENDEEANFQRINVNEDIDRFAEVEDVNIDHPHNNWKRPSANRYSVDEAGFYASSYDFGAKRKEFETNLVKVMRAAVAAKQEDLYKKAQLFYEGFHELFKAIADLKFFFVMNGKQAPEGGEVTGDKDYVQKFFTLAKGALPQYEAAHLDDEL